MKAKAQIIEWTEPQEQGMIPTVTLRVHLQHEGESVKPYTVDYTPTSALDLFGLRLRDWVYYCDNGDKPFIMPIVPFAPDAEQQQKAWNDVDENTYQYGPLTTG